MAEARVRRPPALVTSLLVASALVLAACGAGGDGSGDDGASAGDGAGAGADGATTLEAASFSAAQVGGGELASASLAGDEAVLWFWAPWCTTCRAEAPDVVAVEEALGDEVTFVGVAGRGEEPEMEAFVEETGTGGFAHVVDADGDIWSSYGVISQPAFAFVDDDGSVELHVGPLGEQGLTERLEALTA